MREEVEREIEKDGRDRNEHCLEELHTQVYKSHSVHFWAKGRNDVSYFVVFHYQSSVFDFFLHAWIFFYLDKHKSYF